MLHLLGMFYWIFLTAIILASLNTAHATTCKAAMEAMARAVGTPVDSPRVLLRTRISEKLFALTQKNGQKYWLSSIVNNIPFLKRKFPIGKKITEDDIRVRLFAMEDGELEAVESWIDNYDQWAN